MTCANRMNKRLEAVYNELLRTEIVRGVEPNATNRQKLLDILNAVVPYTAEEKASYTAIRMLCSGNEAKFIEFLVATHKEYFVLAADASAIAKVLAIDNRVNIFWNASTGRFGLQIRGEAVTGPPKKSKYEPKNPRANRARVADGKQRRKEQEPARVPVFTVDAAPAPAVEVPAVEVTPAPVAEEAPAVDAPAVVKPAVVKPAVVKPAVVKPAVVKQTTAKPAAKPAAVTKPRVVAKKQEPEKKAPQWGDDDDASE